MLALHLLGPVELRRDGQLHPLAVRKTAALLVLLALGGPALRPRVASLLWPALDESTGRRNLRRELARLRDLGVGDAVVAEGDRLSLATDVVLDTARFREALRNEDPRSALAWWRGAMAEDLVIDDAPPFADWLAEEREHWRGAWREAMAQAAARDEAEGRSDAALERLDRLLADDPLQERHHLGAMRLLAAGGRREEALARYQRCRDLLQSELGLAPMAETEALAQALRGAPAAPAPAAAAVRAPGARLPAVLPFVGRAAELAALEAAWRGGGALLLVGDGGVGKTRLALDFAAARGAVAHVGCRPGDAERPYAALTRALRLLAGPDPAGADLPRWVRHELARLVPAFGPVPEPLRSAEERMRFFEAVAIAWTTLAEGDFDAVLLDDWHLADAASQALLGHVAQRRREQRGATREWLLLRPELDAAALRRLADDLQATTLALPPLAETEVLDLVRQLSGAASPERFAARLQRSTGGNPFFVTETLRHLAEQRWLQADDQGVWRTPFDDATQDYRELPLPAGVREAVLGRVQRLGSAAVRVLEAAALAGEPFGPELLAPACALSELDTVLAIEQALQSRLLREHEAGGYAFAHDLVQQALDASLTPERRRLAHRRLALGAEAAGASPSAIARHHEASGDLARAAPFRLAAGDAAQHLHALAEAVEQWRRGLAYQPARELAVQLHARLGRALRWLGDVDGARAEVQALQALVPSLAPDVAFDALLEGASTLIQIHLAPDALPMLDALPPAPDALRAARATLRRVEALRETGRLDDARRLAEPLRAGSELHGAERAELLDAMVMIEWRSQRPPAALALLAEASALSARLGDEAGVVRCHYRRAQILEQTGDLDGAEAENRQGLEASRRLGRTGNTLAFLQALCDVYLARGDWALVVETVHQARQPPIGPPRGLLAYVLAAAMATALHALGQAEAAWSEAQPALEQLLQLPEHQRVEAALLLPLRLLAERGERAALDRLARRLLPLVAEAGDEGQRLQQALRAALGAGATA